MSDCIFCHIVNKTIPAEIVYESEEVLAFPDIRPMAPSHLLVIPKKHIASLNEAEESDQALLGSLFLAAPKFAKQLGFASDGYRCVINTGDHGGQTVFHVHLHIIGGRPMQWPPG